MQELNLFITALRPGWVGHSVSVSETRRLADVVITPRTC